MFCPPGYITCSEASIWFGEWMDELYRRSKAFGDPLNLNQREDQIAPVFSSSQLTHLALGFFDDCPSLAICGPGGSLLEPHKMHFLHRADMYWSADWFPEDLRHDGLRLLFGDSEIYVVTLRYWDDIFSDLWKAGAFEDWLLLNRIAQLIAPFDGWAYCISEDDDNRMLGYIVDRFKLPKEVMKEEDFSVSLGGERRKIGRPPMDAAKAAFAEMNFDKAERSWEQMARFLERKTGQKPSPRTMRTWVQENSNSYPPRASSGETEGN